MGHLFEQRPAGDDCAPTAPVKAQRRDPIIRAFLPTSAPSREGVTATKSDLEELFLAFADRTGLPRPETNVYIEGIEVDCVWRHLQLKQTSGEVARDVRRLLGAATLAA